MKNAYEIRSDVLAMAKDYMDKQLELNTEAARKAIEAGEKAVADMPKMYSLEDLMKEAQKMYSFVSEESKKYVERVTKF